MIKLLTYPVGMLIFSLRIPTTPLLWTRTLVGFFMPEHYPPKKRIFSKISLTPEQHIVLLKKRGLIFQDETRACHYLRFIGYFRLSGYFIPFQVPGDPQHTFLPQTTFDQALQVYIFDRKLRLLVMDAVERIEVAIRTTISDVMGLAYSPH